MPGYAAGRVDKAGAVCRRNTPRARVAEIYANLGSALAYCPVAPETGHHVRLGLHAEGCVHGHGDMRAHTWAFRLRALTVRHQARSGWDEGCFETAA